MYELFVSDIFKKRARKFLKKHPEFRQPIKDTLDLLARNPFAGKLKTHKLSGENKGQWAVSLSCEYRILFMFEGHTIHLTNMGSHDEVY